MINRQTGDGVKTQLWIGFANNNKQIYKPFINDIPTSYLSFTNRCLRVTLHLFMLLLSY